MRTSFLRYYILSYAILFCAYSNFGQLSFDNFTIAQGLSQNSVYDITQTKDGILWIGTNDGLNSYDGNSFRMYRPTTTDLIQRSSIIKCLTPFTKQYLIVGTDNEVLLFDLYLKKYQPHGKILPKFELPKDIKPTKIIYREENIWILTSSHGIFKYNTKTQKTDTYFNTETEKNSIIHFIPEADQSILAISTSRLYRIVENKVSEVILPNKEKSDAYQLRTIMLSGDTLVVSSNKYGVQLFKVSTKSQNATHLKDLDLGVSNDIHTIYLSKTKSTLWLGSRTNGITAYDTKSQKYENDKAKKSPNSIKKNFILSVFEDDQYNIWIGQSGGGLARKTNIPIKFKTIKSPEKSNQDAVVFTIMEDKKSMLYMGSLIGGLLSYDKNNNKYTYHTNPSLPVESKNIYDIKEDGNTLWLATWAGLCSFNKISLITKLYTKPDDVKYQKLYALSIIGDKIFTCGEYGMACYNKKTNQWTAVPDSSGYLVKNKVIGRYMSSISDDELGIATTDNNFIIYNIQRGRFKEFSDLKRISVSARHFYKDNQGLWIATDRGLILFNLEKERVVKIWDKSSGLIDDFIYAVSRDSSGNTWFSHNHGVSKLNKDFGQIVNYSLNDGLQDLEFNTASCFKSPNGRIYFGGINGVNEVTGMSEATKNPIKRPLVNKVQILNLDLNSDTSAQYLSNVILKHNQNYISFEYISPNLTSSQGLGYEYILSNFDENWIKAGSRTYVSYTGLTPGTYTFRVRTYDPYGNNSEISNPIRIKITKPFYKHTLFYLLAAFLTFIVFSYYINSRISTIKKRHLTNVKLAKFELNALHSQINSHFIFNSMNSISHMIHDNDNKNAILYLNKFAKLLRSRIEDSKSTFVTLQSEIETVRQYIEIEKLRLENLTFYTSIDTQIDINNTLVPPFVIQPLVEDIIWYKLAGHQGPRELAIHVFSHKNKVVLEIEDSANQVLGYKNELEDHIIKLKAILDRIILFNKKHDTLFELNVIHDPDNMKNTKIKFTINARS